jgi:hypothetical protein
MAMRKKIGRPRLIGPGPAKMLGIHLSVPEATVIERAAKHAGMSVSNYVRCIVGPVALNALAELAATSTVLDKIKQETKVAERTFNIID